jgi:hypothetical protein
VRIRLTVVAGAYVLGVAVAGVIAAAGIRHLASVLANTLATQTVADRQPRHAAQSAEHPPFSPVPGAIHQSVVGSMQPLQDRWSGGSPFGSSSRGSWGSQRERGGWNDDDDDQRSRHASGFRTLCVRLCDGYYFPISFAASRDRFERDAKVCASRCGSQGRLFVHANPGGAAETMVDLAGRPYQELKTAFLYRTEYVASCTCQPQPWEAAAQERHRGYALAQAAGKGNKDAAKELQALQAKQRETAKAPEPVLVREPAQVVRRDGGTLMRLGGGESKAASEARPERAPPAPSPRPDPDWMRRAWQASTGN